MDSPEIMELKLDSEFDEMLVEMKPHVLRLPHKSDRQKCALWIKKFCEPHSSGSTGKKNRNAYAQLIHHMLRKGVLEGPFVDRPDPGPLPTLPSYMSIYYDDAMGCGDRKKDDRVPDWVAGELASEFTVSGISAIGSEGTLSPTSLQLQQAKQRFGEACARDSPPHIENLLGMGLEHRDGYRDPDRDRCRHKEHTPSPHRTKRKSKSSHKTTTFCLDEPAGSPVRAALAFSSDDDGLTNGDDILIPTSSRPPPPPVLENTSDWRTGFSTTMYSSQAPGFQDESSRIPDREVEMRVKTMEAKFEEEKLRLQQKHDSTVQKILDRKNKEIEDLKQHYRTKSHDQDDLIPKLERKVQHLHKELTAVKENRDQQIEELKRLTEDTATAKHSEFEKKLNNAMAHFEQEKFDMQKQHTRNIQELLDDTNVRLQKMEDEYNQQMESTSGVIRELESRVQQLTFEAESMANIRGQLEKEKAELEGKVERLSIDLADHQSKVGTLDREMNRIREEREQEVRSLRNKNEANIEFVKQENNINTVKGVGGSKAEKAADSIADLEQHVNQLKQNVHSSEEQRQKQIRELEQVHQQDKLHLEHLHEKKVRSLQKELDQLEQDYQKKMRKLESSIKDKEDEVRRLVELQRQQSERSEKALEEFKAQVEKNSNRMYEDMRQQMGKVEADLNHSKQMREKQAKEFKRQLEDERNRHAHQVTELKISFEQEKTRMLQELHAQRDLKESEHEHEMGTIKENGRQDFVDLERRARETQERDAKTIDGLERQVHDLREEVVQANQLRKQQLVELGLLREEEKQKLQHEHDSKLSKLRSQMEQQKLEVEKRLNAEMEKTLEKTNSKLKDIENDYGGRNEKSQGTIAEMQKLIQDLKDEVNRQNEQSAEQLRQTTSRLEDEKRKLKHHYSCSLKGLQQELEAHKCKWRDLERKITHQEQDYEEKITAIRSQYEDKMRGLVPVAVRQELEETISSMRSQIGSLQQRAAMLQEEVDAAIKYSPVSHLSGSLANTIGSLASFKSS